MRDKGGFGASFDESDRSINSPNSRKGRSHSEDYDSSPEPAAGATMRRGRSSRSDLSGSPNERSPNRSPSSRSLSRRGRSRSGSPSRRGRSKSRSKSRSQSPNKFGNKDFVHSRQTNSASQKRRKQTLAKLRGMKENLSELTRQELMDKLRVFAKFHQDKKTGSSELIVESKKLLGEEVEVLQEVMHRMTEIQRITIRSCGLKDEEMIGICKGMKSLRHLKYLDLCNNALGTDSVQLLVRLFSRLSRRLESLNLHGNSTLSFKHGRMLFKGFDNIELLNQIPVRALRKVEGDAKQLVLQRLNIEELELGIVSVMLEKMPQVEELNLTENRIDAAGLRRVVKLVEGCPTIVRLNLNENPLLENMDPAAASDIDESGVRSLLAFVQHHTRLQQASWDGAGVPEGLTAQLLQSLMANRAFLNRFSGDYFNKFAAGLVRERGPPEPRMQAPNMLKSLQSIDLNFVRANRLPMMSVSVTPGVSSFETTGLNAEEDDIVVRKVKPAKTPTIPY